jgi:hypothetical protein
MVDVSRFPLAVGSRVETVCAGPSLAANSYPAGPRVRGRSSGACGPRAEHHDLP